MLLHNYLIQSAERFPEKAAVVHKGKTFTYEDIFSGSLSIANWLIDGGLRKGDRVAILMDNPYEYIKSYFGILMAGGIVVALNVQTSVRTLEYQINNCEVFAILTQAKFMKYLSGLTGSVPSVKAVLPFFYSYGNSILLTHFAVGGTLAVRQEFLYPNEIIEDMMKEEVTGFSGVPSTFAILLNRSAIRHYKFPNLRCITQAGGAMSPKLAHDFKSILPHVAIYIMY